MIALANIGLLDILSKLCATVVVTPQIAAEYGDPLPEWIHVQAVTNSQVMDAILNVLDIGESSAIALSLETENALLVLDEKKARVYARNHGLKHTGTIGILLDAHRNHLLNNIEEVLDNLRNSGFRMPADIVDIDA
ncbi:MAG: DUF3368 domain-containing protein [Spirochaetaceae bacterium]|nr:DUF3368 domain-containing protein [Spirochaetaceae bacterium]